MIKYRPTRSVVPNFFNFPVLFQNVFHHIFMRGLDDISSHVIATSMYSIEFTTAGIYCYMSIRFWRGDSLVRVGLHKHLQTDECPDCYLSAISCMLSCVSSKPNLVSISGCSSMVLQALESSDLYDYGIQYPFRFEAFSLPDFMHPNPLQTSHVFGRIDMCSQLKYLVVFLRGSPSQPWALQCPELCKVSPI